jgi:DNA (cytosine-5)-methyltransferase 1
MKVGSLFTGYGGLDLAVGGELAWYAEIEPAACQVLAHHYPEIPNLGDITTINWAEVEPVGVITGGYPCQPFSHAGNRKGKNDERHLWPYVLTAIRAIRPRYAILENVSGHLTLGFADVLADLAEIRWSCEWGTYRASDVGAPHRRERIFIIAHADSEGLQRHDDGSGKAPTRGHRHAEQGAGALASDPLDNGLQHASERMDTRQGQSATARHSTPTTNTSGERHGRGERPAIMGRVGSTAESSRRQTSTARQKLRAGSAGNAADTDSASSQTRLGRQGQGDTGRLQSVERGGSIDWGKYAPAIRRWESVLGRNAPDPVVIRNDKRRLNPQFVEWMMGLPDGWVTGHGLSTAKELKMLGNGVVPQQAHAAIRQLMERVAA